MTVDHSKLDALVFRLIANSSLGLTLASIVASLRSQIDHLNPKTADFDKVIVAESEAIGRTLERAVDKSLQRLRKRQLIFYFSPVVGWRVKEKT